MLPRVLSKYYCWTIESVLTGSIMAWYRNCSIHNRKALQRVMKIAQYITGTVLPPIQDIYSKWCLREARTIIKDPSHELFNCLPSGRQYRSLRSDNRLRDCFYLQTIRLLNT